MNSLCKPPTLRLLARSLSILTCTAALGFTQASSAAVNCKVDNVNAWNNGYTVNVTVTNTGPAAVSNWSVNVNFAEPANITNSWNAQLSGNTTITAKKCVL